MQHLDIWIANFGCQQKIFSDNDGEFFNETLEEINKKRALKTKTTAGDSPFSNGTVERYNKILFDRM